MIQQTEFSLSAKRRGFHLLTGEILGNLSWNLGTWQGIYLCEFFTPNLFPRSVQASKARSRDYGGERRIVTTIIGE